MIFGFLVLNKPAGPSSHDCVAKVRKAYGLKRVGHGGTLDPAVSGVLPIALGPATRLLPYLPGEKTYRAWVQLGLRTSTDDMEGVELERFPIPTHLNRQDIEAALLPFLGCIQQRPPAVSAVHVQGRRAYALARAGHPVELPERPVTVHHLKLLAWEPQQGTLELDVHCSAGTYIRSLARDLGVALGCGGTLARMQRTAALGFQLDQSVPLQSLEDSLPPLLDPLPVLSHLPRQPLAPEDVMGWRCGRPQRTHQPFSTGETVLMVDPDGKLAGLAEMCANGILQPRLVFEASG